MEMSKSIIGLVIATAGVIVAALGTMIRFVSTGMLNGAGIIVIALSCILAVYNLICCRSTRVGSTVCERDIET